MMKDLQVQSSTAIKSRWQMSLASSVLALFSTQHVKGIYFMCEGDLYIYSQQYNVCSIFIIYAAAATADSIKRNKWTRHWTLEFLLLHGTCFEFAMGQLQCHNERATPFWWWWWLNFLDYYEMSSFFLINVFNVLIIIS